MALVIINSVSMTYSAVDVGEIFGSLLKVLVHATFILQLQLTRSTLQLHNMDFSIIDIVLSVQSTTQFQQHRPPWADLINYTFEIVSLLDKSEKDI